MRVSEYFIGTNRRCSKPLRESLGGQERVHGAGAEPFEIQGHELETKRLENTGQFRGHLGRKGTRQLGLGNLDADNLAVVTDTELAEPEASQRILALLDRAEGLARNWASILDARRQASRCRLIPNPQSGGTCQFSNLLLGQSSRKQRGRNMVLASSYLSGTEVGLVIYVDSVGD